MAYPYLTLRTTGNRLFSCYTTGSQNPLPLGMGSVKSSKLPCILDTLKKHERNVLTLRFGLDGGGEKTLEEVGKALNVTRERIRQIEAKALRKMRHPARIGRRSLEYLEAYEGC